MRRGKALPGRSRQVRCLPWLSRPLKETDNENQLAGVCGRDRDRSFRGAARVGSSCSAGWAAGAGDRDAKAWTPARTPWGDPDLQGYFTNKDEQGIPMERAPEFAGRTTVSDEEFAAREEQLRRQLLTDSAEFDLANADTSNAGAVGSATSPPPHWLDRGKPSRRTSRIVDPADGRIPPMTAEGKSRAAARRPPNRFDSRAPASYQDGGLYDRCITRGLPGSMMPAIYGNSYQIVQGPGYVAIRYEMIHEIRVIPLNNRQHVSPAIRTYIVALKGRRWSSRPRTSSPRRRIRERTPTRCG